MGASRELRNSLLLGLALTAFSLALHFLPIWENTLNRGAETWDGRPLAQDFVAQVVEEHRSGKDISFLRRPLTTWGVDALAACGLSIKTAFITLGFALFFISGLLVARTAQKLGHSPREALIAQAFFHLSPTVLFAWFDPMYTYDEPLQYAAVLAALLAMLHDRFVLAAPMLAVALMAHETTVFLLPAFALIAGPGASRRIAIVAAPLIMFAIAIAVHLHTAGLFQASENDAMNRLGTWSFNFSSWAMTGETICCAALALFLPVFLLKPFTPNNEVERSMLLGFWIALVVNTIAVLVAAKAREARVFALPMLLTWPIMGKALLAEFERRGGWKKLLASFAQPVRAFGLVAATVGVVVFVRWCFQPSAVIPQDDPFQEYFAAELVLVLVFSFAGAALRSHLRSP